MSNNNIIRDEWDKWIRDFAPWKSFVTLTFRDIVTRDQCENQFRFLLQVLNRDLYGNHYTRINGHCYFAYVVGLEVQKRGALHLHFLADKPINYQLLHTVWNRMSGFAFIKPVSDMEGVIHYLTKYITKGGDLMPWKPAKFKEPAFAPEWYQRVSILDPNFTRP